MFIVAQCKMRGVTILRHWIEHNELDLLTSRVSGASDKI